SSVARLGLPFATCRLLRRVKKQEPKRKERSFFLNLPSRLISCSSTPGGHPNVTTDSYLTGGGALPNNGVSRMIGASRICTLNDFDQACGQRRADVRLDLQLRQLVAAGAAAIDDRDGQARVAGEAPATSSASAPASASHARSKRSRGTFSPKKTTSGLSSPPQCAQRGATNE